MSFPNDLPDVWSVQRILVLVFNRKTALEIHRYEVWAFWFLVFVWSLTGIEIIPVMNNLWIIQKDNFLSFNWWPCWLTNWDLKRYKVYKREFQVHFPKIGSVWRTKFHACFTLGSNWQYAGTDSCIFTWIRIAEQWWARHVPNICVNGPWQ